MVELSVIAGARPNFIKIAPLVRAFQAVGLRLRLIHTGQHYDDRMSGTFFRDLEIPEPDVNLGVGSGTHVAQISEVMRRLEREFLDHPPRGVVVVGDVNSTLAAALTAVKLGISVAHVEAGLRSFDRTMPEEINRILTDAVSELLFTSEPAGELNLRQEGVAANRIYHVGNVMIDSLRRHLNDARQSNAWKIFGLDPRRFAVCTLHRPSNVDDSDRLSGILQALGALTDRMPIVFPVHPRTATRIRELQANSVRNRLHIIEPQSYLSMLSLVDASRMVLTDSGGLQEETTALRVPCLTLRENTERPITVERGSNRLVGWQQDRISAAIDEVLAGPERCGDVPRNWDGHAAERIAETIVEKLSSDRAMVVTTRCQDLQRECACVP